MSHYFTRYLLIIAVFYNTCYSQIFMDTSAMTVIHNARTANEGDMYLDTINGVFRIGLTHGEMGYLIDDQNIDSMKILGDTALAIYIERGQGDTISLGFLFDSTKRQEEWVDGDSISISNLIYAKQALLNGDTIVFTDTASLGIGTAYPSASIDVAKGGIRIRDYDETRADDTSGYLNTLYTDANGFVKSGRREIVPPVAYIDAAAVSAGNTFNYYNHYATQMTNVGLSAIPVGNFDFYVLSYDVTVFANVSISAVGVLTYDIIATTTTQTFIDVRFYTK